MGVLQAVILLATTLDAAHGADVRTQTIEVRRPAPAPWLASAAPSIEREEYAFAHAGDGEVAAPNRAHGLRVRLGSAGLQVSPRRDPGPGERGWELRLGLRRWGRGENLLPVGAGTPHVSGARAELPHGPVTSWFLNEPRGLEQGFTVHEPPEAQDGPLVLEVEVAGMGARRESADVLLFTDSSGSPALRYSGLVVTDATGRVLPATMRSAPHRLLFEVDDRGAVYPVTVDPLMTGAVWIAESNQVGGTLGLSVAAAGDVNADGFSDFLVGAQLYDGGHVDEGKAFLYLGAAGGPSNVPAWSFEGDQTDVRVGFSMAGVGDLDADGYDDIVVGAYGFDAGQADEGVVWVFRGGPAGLSATPSQTLEGNQAGAAFGIAVAAAGDVNGDGFADVVVGASQFDNGQTDEGAAYVFRGSASGLVPAPFWTGEGNQAGALYGYAVSTAFDTNADGYDDVVVGARRWDAPFYNEGGAWAYLGSPSGMTLAWQGTGINLSEEYGWAVAGAGDVNGDGYADIVVGAPYRDFGGSSQEGAVSLYYGSASGPSAAAASWAPRGAQSAAYFGYAVAPAGDVNGDGYADIAVGAPLYDYGATDDGRAFVFLGSPSGPEASASWGVSAFQASAQMGIAVVTAGDVNGDGYSDVLVGANGYDNPEIDEGRAYLYLGGGDVPALAPNWTAESNQGFARLGVSLGGGGDVNGDGFGDFVSGAYLYDGGQSDEGGVMVWLGSASGPPANPSAVLEVNQAFARLGQSVALVGDVNGDGYDDVLAGAPYWSDGQVGEGAAFLFAGSSSGIATTPLWSADGDQNDAHFGLVVAGAGDVDADGYADILVAAPDYDNDQVNEGRVYLYLGSPTGPAATPAWIAESWQEYGCFGCSVAGAGDVNGDGYSDVVVGMPWWDQQFRVDNGKALIYLGNPTGLNAVPSWEYVGLEQAQLGSAVATAGDVNGDGFSDVLIGAPYDSYLNTWAGTTIVAYGSGTMTPAPLWFIDTLQGNALLGASVASAGDVNGDGYSDVQVAAPYYDNGQADEGSVFLYLGSDIGLSPGAAWSSESNQAGAVLGSATAAVGDVNGDGFSDVVTVAYAFSNGQSQEGRLFFYYGNRQRGLDRSARHFDPGSSQRLGRFAWSSSESSIGIRATGRTAAGRGPVRLEVEARQLGLGLSGLPTSTGAWSDTEAPTASGSRISIDHVVDGLQPGKAQHWQARLASKSPFFPRTPWFTNADSNRTEGHLRTHGCVDYDGDGYGARASGACEGPGVDCNDLIPTIRPGGTEVCDGVDQDCDGIVDDADPPSGAIADLTLTEDREALFTLLDWGAVPGATAYDTVRGDLASLRVSGGVGGSGTTCLSNNYPPTDNGDDAVPSSGAGFYYLIRPVNCGGAGSYDASDPSQAGSRDPGLATSPACP